MNEQEAQRATYRAPEYFEILHGHLVSPLICRGPWMSTVVLYCWCHSDSASVLLYFTCLCQVSLNSIQRFHSRSQTCLSQSEAGRPSCFSDRPEKKTQTLWRMLSSCLLLSFVEFCSMLSEEKSKMSQPIRGHLVFPIGPKKTQTLWRMLSSCLLLSFVKFCPTVSEEKSKTSQPIRGHGGHLVFPIGLQNTNLDIEFASCQVSLNSVQRFQRPGLPSCFFSDRPKNHNFWNGQWDLASCHVSWNSVQPF